MNSLCLVLSDGAELFLHELLEGGANDEVLREPFTQHAPSTRERCVYCKLAVNKTKVNYSTTSILGKEKVKLQFFF